MGLLEDNATELATLAAYGAGIAVYALLVMLLCVPMSTRMMFAKRVGGQEIATAGGRLLYALLFPIVSFLFFVLISSAMLFLGSFNSATQLTPRDILTTAMAVVLAIRVCSYFSEYAATDLAKVMPLGLLGVVLVTNGLDNLRDSLGNLRAFVEEGQLIGLYFVAVVVVEAFLRLVYEALGRPTRRREAARARVHPSQRR